ncbi:MAG: AI-2E family transporter [Bifidobacteriaceae bacterium]|nr:AI-2E family transporter [Bifidobacteriaceae bacterium]
MEETEKRYYIGKVFPDKGDPKHPPEWLWRALIMCVVTVFVAIFAWNSWSSVSWIFLDLVICIFIALAMEPGVLFLIRHGWKRGAAAGFVWGLVILALVGLLTLFGSLFVSQIVGLVQSAPDVYTNIADFVAKNTPWKMPNLSDLGSTLVSSIQTSWITDFAGQAVSTTSTIVNVLLQMMTIILVTYYIAASGPIVRKKVCALLKPQSQRKFLVVWTVVQNQISSFLNSRIILAAIASTVLSIFMISTGVPYWLPICLFYAIVAQFIPMVGAFIGAVLPIVVTWSSKGFTAAIIIAAFILVYQQIENMLIAPKIQQRTMSVHPAIGLLAVFVFGAIFGVLGSFLALPVVASIQVIFSAYTKKQDLVESPLLDDPVPVKKSKVVEAGEAFSEHVVKPIADHLPRAARGSTVRVTTDAQLADVERELANYTPADKLDESATIAIPKTSKEDLEMQAQQTPSSGSGSKRKLWGSKGMEQPPSFDAEAASTSESPDGAAEDARESASKEEK